MLQIAWEIKALDAKKYILLSGKLDEIGRMLGGWLKQLTLASCQNEQYGHSS